jgi:heme exporter protein C
MRSRGIAFLVALVGVAMAMAWLPRMILAAPLPVEPNGMPMAWAQKIFYFHVPCAWCAFLSVFVSAGGSIAQLWKRSRRGDALAFAAAELVVVFGLCTLVTGPLWARKEWGHWWVWKDVRLVTMLILWVTFIAYLFVRRYGGPGSNRLAAGLSLFGAVNVPIVYLSVFFWRTQHPEGRVVSNLGPGMSGPFWLSFATVTVVYLLALGLRVKLERARQRLDDAHLAAEEAGLIEA